jgi:hypothetical protein
VSVSASPTRPTAPATPPCKAGPTIARTPPRRASLVPAVTPPSPSPMKAMIRDLGEYSFPKRGEST